METAAPTPRAPAAAAGSPSSLPKLRQRLESWRAAREDGAAAGGYASPAAGSPAGGGFHRPTPSSAAFGAATPPRRAPAASPVETDAARRRVPTNAATRGHTRSLDAATSQPPHGQVYGAYFSPASEARGGTSMHRAPPSAVGSVLPSIGGAASRRAHGHSRSTSGDGGAAQPQQQLPLVAPAAAAAAGGDSASTEDAAASRPTLTAADEEALVAASRAFASPIAGYVQNNVAGRAEFRGTTISQPLWLAPAAAGGGQLPWAAASDDDAAAAGAAACSSSALPAAAGAHEAAGGGAAAAAGGAPHPAAAATSAATCSGTEPALLAGAADHVAGAAAAAATAQPPPPPLAQLMPTTAPGSPFDLALQSQAGMGARSVPPPPAGGGALHRIAALSRMASRLRRPHKPRALKRLEQGDAEFTRRQAAKALGAIIDKEHVQYQLSYAMMLGIYTSVVTALVLAQRSAGAERLLEEGEGEGEGEGDGGDEDDDGEGGGGSGDSGGDTDVAARRGGGALRGSGGSHGGVGAPRGGLADGPAVAAPAPVAGSQLTGGAASASSTVATLVPAATAGGTRARPRVGTHGGLGAGGGGLLGSGAGGGSGGHRLALDDFMAVTKLVFPPGGSHATPPHPLSAPFKFKDYAPATFHALRERFGVDQTEYLRSLGGAYEYIEFNSNSKSGSFFFYSHDGRFMIKTQTRAESKFLRRILAHYYAHVMASPHSYITRFYGMHRLKMPHLRRKIHFTVMASVFASGEGRAVHEMYDLKGSLVGRAASDAEKARGPARCVFKDVDLAQRGVALKLGPGRREAFLAQVASDAAFLQRCGIMDYSLLLGVHYRSRHLSGEGHALVRHGGSAGAPPPPPPGSPPVHTEPDGGSASAAAGVEAAAVVAASDVHLPQQQQQQFGGAVGATSASASGGSSSSSSSSSSRSGGGGGGGGSGGASSRMPPSPQLANTRHRLDRHLQMVALGARGEHVSGLPPGAPQVPPGASALAGGGIPAGPAAAGGAQPDEVYFLGIIDILQQYDLRKLGETALKAMVHPVREISAVSPAFYAQRFVAFLAQHTQ